MNCWTWKHSVRPQLNHTQTQVPEAQQNCPSCLPRSTISDLTGSIEVVAVFVLVPVSGAEVTESAGVACATACTGVRDSGRRPVHQSVTRHACTFTGIVVSYWPPLLLSWWHDRPQWPAGQAATGAAARLVSSSWNGTKEWTWKEDDLFLIPHTPSKMLMMYPKENHTSTRRYVSSSNSSMYIELWEHQMSSRVSKLFVFYYLCLLYHIQLPTSLKYNSLFPPFNEHMASAGFCSL